MDKFDAVVVGGGHAGVEATRALSSMGYEIAVVTLDAERFGAMSCNPAIGGVAKSHLVFEVDALGGLMGACADASGIQCRRLNSNKGPAVRSTRVQCDKDRYTKTMSSWMRTLPLTKVFCDEAVGFCMDRGANISGVRLASGLILHTRVIILTAGTFMRGLMFCGESKQSGGRFGDKAADYLSGDIEGLGHRLKRLKTGTPSRLDARTIDFTKIERQWGDPERRNFSWRANGVKLPQVCCYITHTNEQTHDIIRGNFHRSPLFSGEIAGIGPRYCPSVEDKVKRFPDRSRHQIFLEPEGLDTNSIYPNGLSTSLPADVQLLFLRTIRGLENVKLLRPGYAVEYDTIDPRDLNSDLSSKFARGLFFAGQVNRTSGYEEAAAQGLWAGINAGLMLRDLPSIRPDRSRSYMETLVDDLTQRGTEEPYRMFTSRSEFRLCLREDNAIERMSELGRKCGILSEGQMASYDSRKLRRVELLRKIDTTRIKVSHDRAISLREYLKRPEVVSEDIAEILKVEIDDELILERIEIQIKYEGYLKKQEQEIRELEQMRDWKLDVGIDIMDLASVSTEAAEKYRLARPANVEELLRISGMTPVAALAIIRRAGRSSGAKNVSRETRTI